MREASDNVTATVVTVPPAAITLRATVPEIDPEAAVIMTAPGATAETVPELFTVATPFALELHVSDGDATTAPAAVRATALSETVCAGDNVEVEVETSMRLMIAAGGSVVPPVLSPPPQLATVNDAAVTTTALATRRSVLKRRVGCCFNVLFTKSSLARCCA